VYADKTLSCRDCGESFIFTTDEQMTFASRGYSNVPGRCPDCLSVRRTNHGSSFASADARSYERVMYPAVCAQCAQATEVPFKPRDDRPVYCSSCYSAQRSRSDAGARGGRASW
jgi:CxxC-x17-CxxC domain-containing protein